MVSRTARSSCCGLDSDKLGFVDCAMDNNPPSRVKTIEDSEAEFLELRQVNVARGERVVLHDIDLTIRAGEHVAILGPNGCGKSTLILAMTCQIYPMVQPGMMVRIFGRERWDLSQLRRRFGVVAAGLLGELPGERTAVTTGLDAVIAGFFSASTLWPNLHVTAEMRERAVELSLVRNTCSPSRRLRTTAWAKNSRLSGRSNRERRSSRRWRCRSPLASIRQTSWTPSSTPCAGVPLPPLT